MDEGGHKADTVAIYVIGAILAVVYGMMVVTPLVEWAVGWG